MIKNVVLVQFFVLLSVTGLLYIFGSSKAGETFFCAGISLIIPNLFLAINVATVKISPVFFWFGLALNKFIAVLLLLVSVKLLVEPVWAAFLFGIIVMSHVPFGYGLYASIRSSTLKF